MTIEVTVVDEQTGERETRRVEDGDYVIICTDPCHVASTQAHGNGTHVITVKGRRGL